MEFPKGDHYNLRWTNYTNNLIQVFSEHRHHENLVDVTFACEGEFIKAHKLILSACSDFFEGMFKTHSSVPHPIIFLNGIKFKHLKCIMEFIYHGEVKVQDEDLEEVIVLGKNLKIKGLCTVHYKHNTIPEQKQELLDRKSTPVSTHSSPITVKDSPVSVQSKNVTAKQPPIPNAELPMTNPPVSASDLPPHNLPPSPSKYVPSSSDFTTFYPPPTLSNSSATQTSTDLEENINDTVSKSVKSKEFENLRTSDIFSSSLGGESTKFAPNRPETENGKSVAEPVAKKRKSPEASTNSSKSRILPSLQDLEHTPKPPSAFMIFRNEWSKKVKAEHPNANNKELSLKLSEMWKSLSLHSKQTYYQAEKKLGEEFEMKCSSTYKQNQETQRRKIARRKTMDAPPQTASREDDDDIQIIEERTP